MKESKTIKDLVRTWDSNANLVSEYYQRRIAKSGISEESLDWRDRKSCLDFYDNALSLMEPSTIYSIFDIGCGTANFYYYFKEKYRDVVYAGIDIVPQFIEYAKSLNRDLDVSTSNFVSYNSSNKYDLVVNMGGLNSRVECFVEYIKYNILKMIDMSNKYVIFNVIIKADNGYFGNSNETKTGHITFMEESKLIEILEEIKKMGYSYQLKKKSVFQGSQDAFVAIKK